MGWTKEAGGESRGTGVFTAKLDDLGDFTKKEKLCVCVGGSCVF